MSRPWVVLVPPVGALIAVIGCLGAWQTANPDDGSSHRSFSGLDFGDGVVFLVGALVLGAAALVANRRWMHVVIAGLAVLGVVGMGFDIADLDRGTVDFGVLTVDYSVAWGAVLTELGLVALAAASIYRAVTAPPRPKKPKGFFEAPEAVIAPEPMPVMAPAGGPPEPLPPVTGGRAS